VVIPRGTSSSQAVRLLADNGVIRSPAVFRTLLWATRSAGRIRFGEYTFPSPPSALETWRKLTSGDVTRFDVVLPPGTNLHDMDRTLSELGLTAKGEFLETARRPALLARLGIPGESAEGFLFPDTYRLVKGDSAEEILEILYRRFRQALSPELEREIARSGYSLEQVVTIASIIEKETGSDPERPLVSAVIRNRLALGMPLQMDPTVIYGRKIFGKEITKEDLRADNPYNTYTRRGLPPGPICSPGLPSIRAALSPAPEKYLYFVSRNDGTHRFSGTLGEHNRAVEQYWKSVAAGKEAEARKEGGGAEGSGAEEGRDGGAGSAGAQGSGKPPAAPDGRRGSKR
jgi:UPF0755 protein